MILYLDSDYKCHVADDGTMRPFESDVFSGKCKTYIECFRAVPEGLSWVRDDGAVFGPQGTMISPWKEGYLEAQAAYEQAQSEAITAYEEGVNAAYE